MAKELTRRRLLEVAGATGVAGAASVAMAADVGKKTKPNKLKIIGICCSPRKGKTTAASLRVCLAAAKDVAARIGPRLAEAAVAAKVDDKLVDLSCPLTGEHDVRIVTPDDPEALPAMQRIAS